MTETDIDLAGVIPIQEGEFRKPVLNLAILTETHPLLQSAATCHTLIRVNGQLSGYSIDRKMFDASKWNFAEGPAGVNPNYGVETPFIVNSPTWDAEKRQSSSHPAVEMGVLKRFPFESHVKRMTVSLAIIQLFPHIALLQRPILFPISQVIAQRKGSEHYSVFIKGAPETIAALCDPVTGSPQSNLLFNETVGVLTFQIDRSLCTVPANYLAVLKHYTIQGYRVLALASKTPSPHLGFGGLISRGHTFSKCHGKRLKLMRS